MRRYRQMMRSAGDRADRADGAEAVKLATCDGVLAGQRANGVDRYRGVPYAAPPTGPRRFAAPVPPVPWSGIRDATSEPTRAVQPIPPVLRQLETLRPGTRFGEDCLNVDVVSPTGASGLPVLVWIHGGAYRVGGAGDYDGAPLARLGEMVVVTVTYRLGALGFLDLPDALGVDPDDIGYVSNAGLRDVIAALRWVQESIASFGGDPARVTVAGQSSGAGLVGALLVSPHAAGLFAGAIAASGGLNMTSDREEAANAAREFLVALGVGTERPERLRTASARAVLAAMRTVDALRPDGLPFRPWFDGDLLPVSRQAAAAAPTAAVPLMIGTNRDEYSFFRVFRQAVVPMRRERIAVMLLADTGARRAETILGCYPDDRRGLGELGTDAVFTMPALAMAERHGAVAPSWVYRFDFGSARFGLGAFHAIDLMFLFDGPRALRRALLGPFSPDQQALAGRLRQHWAHFVRSGTPGPGWPRYKPPERLTKVFNLADAVVADPAGDRRRAWHGADQPAW